MGQVPRENASAPLGSEVVLLVSSGPAETERVRVALPDVVGSSETDAVNALQQAGLGPQVTYDYSPAVPAGIVMEQLPNAADASAPPAKRSPWIWVALILAVLVIAAAAVFLLRGCQAEQVEVPDVVGMEMEKAVATIEAAGFEAQSVEADEPGDDVEEGEVAAQMPEAGSLADEGSTVTISVVGAPEPVEVPDLIGLTEEQATERLEEAGLRANARTQEDASAKAGTVIEQSPEEGSEVEPGSRVDITIAIEAKATEVKVPDVIGESQDDAEATLEDAGLDVTVVENPSDTVEKGVVILQLPTGGTVVAVDSEIAIVVSSGPSQTQETVTVPDVVGMPRADAEKALRDAGLEVESVAVGGVSEDIGDVFAQAPASGSTVPKGSIVTVVFAE